MTAMTDGPFHSMQRFAELVGQAKIAETLMCEVVPSQWRDLPARAVEVGDEEFEHTVRGLKLKP